MRELRRILLVRTDRLGDVVLTTPAATLLKRAYPAAEIHFLTRAYTAPLVQLHEDISRIIVYDPEGEHHGFQGHLRLAKTLQQGFYDAAFLFYPTFPLAWVLFQAGIPVRVGTGFRWYSALFFNYKWYEHRKTGILHEVEYNLNLLRHFIPVSYDEVAFRFKLPQQLVQWWQEYREVHHLPAEYAIVHPGSGGSAPNLTLEQYAGLIQMIITETQLPVLLTGSPAEEPLLQQLKAKIPDAPVFLPGVSFDLQQLAVIISQARLFASTSTGPLHIANAFKVPVMGFYCPAPPCSPVRWGPYGQQQWAIVPRVTPCQWCKVEKCPHGNCLSHISKEEIGALVHRRWKALENNKGM